MVSYKKAMRRLANPFTQGKTNSKSHVVESDQQSAKLTNKSSQTSFESDSDMTMSPTSVGSSALSCTTEDTATSIETDQWMMQRPVAVPSRPALVDSCPEKGASEESSQYGLGDATQVVASTYGSDEASPDAKTKYGYEDAAPCRGGSRETNQSDRGTDAPASEKVDYGYGDAAPSGFGGDSTSRRRTPRRSSMKQSGCARRASIQLCGEVENVLPNSNGKKVRRRTSITFNDAVKVKKVAPIKVLTDKPEALWFQDEEFDRMKQKCFDIVDKVDQGCGKNYCVRGLERLSDAKREEVLGRKYDAWDTVLDEQDHQRESGQFDDGHMANVYKFTTMQTQIEAEDRARQDVAAIENYLRDTRRLCRRLSM
mmetsp:Transcript_15786/g.24681  ORF Transcript_15786/g.24681 Transcript_15786/m.24681 type:complete len:369 (-) Transcript_15786:184-1290(-)